MVAKRVPLILVPAGEELGSCPTCGGLFDSHDHGGVYCLSCGERFSVAYEDDAEVAWLSDEESHHLFRSIQ